MSPYRDVAGELAPHLFYALQRVQSPMRDVSYGALSGTAREVFIDLAEAAIRTMLQLGSLRPEPKPQIALVK